ncbi:spore coat protein SP96-like [Saccostrea cucullata]|uniref:spore coat protein SP96-like n=1 Tax=Saccostrea cuccullata TaxID=36930 RepID=UPI002ED416D2
MGKPAMATKPVTKVKDVTLPMSTDNLSKMGKPAMATKPVTEVKDVTLPMSTDNLSKMGKPAMVTKPVTDVEDITMISNPNTKLEGSTLSTHTIFRMENMRSAHVMKGTSKVTPASTLGTRKPPTDVLSDIATVTTRTPATISATPATTTAATPATTTAATPTTTTAATPATTTTTES